jgi:hypothetical protein
MAGLERLAELDEEPLDPKVGLIFVPANQAERSALISVERAEDAGDLHQMGLMVTSQRVELRRDEERLKVQRRRPPDRRSDQR